jgi:hypothetical protein
MQKKERPKGLSEEQYQKEKGQYFGYIPKDGVVLKLNRKQRRAKLRSK